MRLRVITALVTAIAGASLAHAQSESVPASSYSPEYFAQFAPRTALDMVAQVPGFSFQSDNDDGARGFGQASGNVLINGQRISGKSNGVADALGRIPAADVTRIEIVDGTSLDIPGLSGRVVNVISKSAAGVSGTWSWNARIREDLPPYFDDIEVALSGTRGAMSWTLKAESEPDRGAASGDEHVFDGAGNLIGVRDEDQTFIGVNPSVSGSLGWKLASGHIANINGAYTLWQTEQKEVSKQFPVGGPEGRRLFQSAEDEWNTEIGGDYEFGVGPGRLKTIGLMRLEHSPTINRSSSATLGAGINGRSVFARTVDEGEYILRGEYAWSRQEGRDWQVSLEGAFNYLESEAALREATGDGPLVDVPLSNASSRVEEKRGELSITHGRQPTSRLSLQASLGVEMSELSQSGAAGQTRTFTRPKGFVQAAWKQTDNRTITTRLAREVGQLNFFDFITSVNLEAGNDTQGNTDLVPQQAWILSVEAEQDLGRWGALSVKVFGENIEDIVDTIPIGTGAGPGNIDSAHRFGIDIDATVKLDGAGIPGGQIKLEAGASTSEVEDSITGQTRRIDGDRISQIDVEFRQDIPNSNWSYGGGFDSYGHGAHYSLDEILKHGNRPGVGSVFVEHKDIAGMTGRVTLGNLVDQSDFSRREFYDGTRLGALTGVEDRDRRFGPIFTIGLEGSF